jgi:hypothetical protein
MSSGVRSSGVSTTEPSVERTTSNESFSSVDLDAEKGEMKNVNPHHHQGDESTANSSVSVSTAATAAPHLEEPEKTMPGQF